MAGKILPDIASSTRIWHTCRAQVGEDHAKSAPGLFDKTYLQSFIDFALRQADLDYPPQSFSKCLHEMNKQPIDILQWGLHVKTALKKCPNGSAAGLDKIHY
jgi:hypothetical protein